MLKSMKNKHYRIILYAFFSLNTICVYQFHLNGILERSQKIYLKDHKIKVLLDPLFTLFYDFIFQIIFC